MPVIIAGGALIGYDKPDFDLLQYARPIVDLVEQGNSTIELTPQSDGDLIVEYVLGSGVQYPFVGLQLPFSEEVENVRLAKLDMTNRSIDFEIEVDREIRFPFRITVDLPGFTNPENELTYLYLQRAYGLEKGVNKLRIAARELNRIPEWWYTVNGFNELNVPAHDLTNAVNVTVFSDPNSEVGQSERFVVRKAIVTMDYNWYWIWTIPLLVITYLCLALVFRQKVKEKVLVPIKHSTPVESVEPEPLALVVAYIGDAYPAPDLKLLDVATVAGISSRQVSELLMAHCGLSYKAYLNRVRVEAAKVLLKGSSLQISEIGYEVGYNSPQHFARVFSEIAGESATNFRLKQFGNQ